VSRVAGRNPNRELDQGIKRELETLRAAMMARLDKIDRNLDRVLGMQNNMDKCKVEVLNIKKINRDRDQAMERVVSKLRGMEKQLADFKTHGSGATSEDDRTYRRKVKCPPIPDDYKQNPEAVSAWGARVLVMEQMRGNHFRWWR